MAIRYVLWDFGDTLVDQDWMLTPPDDYPGWPEAWAEAARGKLEVDWYVNKLTCEDIARRVSELLGIEMSATMAHIRSCCSNIRFFEETLKTALACPLPRAIVTVNPDVFTRFVVPKYRLAEHFPVIVTSWEEGTVDKATLCARAMERLGGVSAHADTLLIDNNEDAVRDWRLAGGQGYVYRGESQFVFDLETQLAELTV